LGCGRTLAAGNAKGINGSSTGAEDLESPSGSDQKGHPQNNWRKGLGQMGLVGAMRFATVVLGLVSLKHVAASFTETIKASAPFFTVIIAYLMLGEKTSLKVFVTLVPVAAGLVMVSYSELSFNLIGFSAAVLTNVIECVQNVFSKRLLAKDYTASQLQFYTSLTALVLQAPMFLVTMNWSEPAATSSGEPVFVNVTFPNGTVAEIKMSEANGVVYDQNTIILLWIAGVLYHLQSVVAYVVMTYMSPVTVSVVNTIKRAMAIWVSVLFFGNQVTPGAALGTGICLLGALWYNFERQRPPAAAAGSSSKDQKEVPASSPGRHAWKSKS